MHIAVAGRNALIARVGIEFYERYLTLDSAACVARVHEDPARLRWTLAYRMRIPETPGISYPIWFDVDSAGVPDGSRGFHGVSDCVNHPELCRFFYNAGNARDFARIAGLQRGRGQWRVGLRWITVDSLPRYVWMVSNTLVDRPDYTGGEDMCIDPATGKVLTVRGNKVNKWHIYTSLSTPVDPIPGQRVWWK